LKGQTNNQILQDQGVHIWDGNSTREFLDHRGLTDYKTGDIGPMYGYQMRHFGAKYQGCDHDYTGQGIDQLEDVLKLLKNDPFSRRIAMTTYNVADLDKGVLHPCHGIYVQFYVEIRNEQKHLSCHMTQRSVDCGCGLPFNIASYAILTHLIAQKVNMIPNELIISTGDTHIYLNHVDALKSQLQRNPNPFPMLKIKNVKDKDWSEIVVDDFELIGYFSHPAIKLIMNV
jgi:thymidylate synthase